MAKNKSENLTPAESLATLLEFPRFSVETSLFVALSGLDGELDEDAVLLLPAVSALRSELGRIVGNASENANLAKIGKVGKDGDRKVTVGKGTTTVKAGFVASIADAALWVGESVKRTGGSLSINGLANAFPEKHPLRVAAIDYLESKQPKEDAPKEDAKPADANA